jgi:hypothetical protein
MNILKEQIKIIEKQKEGKTDDITNKLVTKKTAEAASKGKKFFNIVERNLKGDNKNNINPKTVQKEFNTGPKN